MDVELGKNETFDANLEVKQLRWKAKKFRKKWKSL